MRFDLAAAAAIQAKSWRFLRVGGTAVLAAAAVSLVVATLWIAPWDGAHRGYLVVAAAGAGMLLVIAWRVFSIEPASLRALEITPSGLTFEFVRRPARTVSWTDPSLCVEVWDATSLPSDDERAEAVAPFGFGMATVGMPGRVIRSPIPRGAYDGLLDHARSHGLVVLAAPDKGDPSPTYRIQTRPPPGPNGEQAPRARAR